MFLERLFHLLCLILILALAACAAPTDQEPPGTAGDGQNSNNEQTVNNSLSNTDVNNTVDAISPTAPGNVRLLVPAEFSAINITWDVSTDNVGVSGYRIFRDGVLLSTEIQNTYVDTSVTESTGYQYIVEAFDAENNLSRSGVLDVVTPAVPVVVDTEAPSVPVNLTTIDITSSQVTLGWSASTDNVGVSGYRIYRDGVFHITTTSFSFIDSGLSAGQMYVYSVSAYDAAGNESLLTADLSITTVVVPVGQPVVLSWQAPTQNSDDSCINSDIQNYELHYGQSSGNYSVTSLLDLSSGLITCEQVDFDAVCNVPVMRCTHTIEAVEAGNWYFAIQAVDSSGVISSFSNEVSKLVN
ncbi:MAG: fibronectin type III domain-containing protein [Gammaproteobacteria bacterium]|nr:fibronectin type III domain-containing protein [Gammaproteobacteria bacterium]